jgi:hypothetical protein
MAKMSMLAMPMNVVTIDVSYPAKMAIYKKDSPWTSEEIRTRTATGSTKFTSIALSKSYFESTIDPNSGATNFRIEYMNANKSGDTSHYLIPTLRYNDASGSLITLPMIE